MLYSLTLCYLKWLFNLPADQRLIQVEEQRQTHFVLQGEKWFFIKFTVLFGFLFNFPI